MGRSQDKECAWLRTLSVRWHDQEDNDDILTCSGAQVMAVDHSQKVKWWPAEVSSRLTPQYQAGTLDWEAGTETYAGRLEHL